MTLVVSLRVLDGVVLAADSLATLLTRFEANAQVEADCGNCGNRVMIDDVYQHAKSFPACPSCAATIEIPKIDRPAFQTASSTLSFAQKLFPFLDVFGVAVFGASALGNKTLFNHLKGFERRLRSEIEAKTRQPLTTLSDVAAAIQSFCIAEFETAMRGGALPAQLPPEPIFGLQVVGYDGVDDPTAKTAALVFGKAHHMQIHEGLGYSINGDIKFPSLLLQASSAVGMSPAIEGLSLQDAIDYADFLVSTTATAQRFANMIPTVGGDVDIALITNYSEFRWIRSKPLARVLEPRYASALSQ